MKKTLIPVSMLLLLAGCASPMLKGTPFYYKEKPDTEALRASTARDEIRAEVQRLGDRVEEVARANARTETRVAALEGRVSDLAASGVSPSELEAIRGEISRVRADSTTIRQKIVDDLSSRIDKMAASSGSRGASSSGAAARNRGSGYEHKVEKGQTLSEIAAGYGVSIQSIMNANNIKNPSALRVGQTLFIPDAKK